MADLLKEALKEKRNEKKTMYIYSNVTKFDPIKSFQLFPLLSCQTHFIKPCNSYLRVMFITPRNETPNYKEKKKLNEKATIFFF